MPFSRASRRITSAQSANERGVGIWHIRDCHLTRACCRRAARNRDRFAAGAARGRSGESLGTGRKKDVSVFRGARMVAGFPAATGGTFTASQIPPQVKQVMAFIFMGNP